MRFKEASHRLRMWLDRERRGAADLARLLKKDRSTIYRWRRGVGRPDAVTAHRLQVISHNAIPADLWYPETEGEV